MGDNFNVHKKILNTGQRWMWWWTGGGLMFNVGQLVEGFFHFPSQNLASPWQGLQ